jgi:hypothetical protein
MEGMNEGTQRMTLGEYIERMKAGWGFWRGSRVQRIGIALDCAIPPQMREIAVDVSFLKGNYGSGPNFHYTYEWRVDGIPVPGLEPGKLEPSAADRLFGYTAGMLPGLYLRPNGFCVSYEY